MARSAREQCSLRSPCRLVHPLLPVPLSRNPRMSHLLLQLKDAIHKRLTRRRATRHINIDRHNSITAPHYTVRVMIITTTVRTRAHGDDPTRLRHLIVDLTQGWCHLVGQGAGYDHDVGLTRRGTENDTQAILVVAWGREVHHFDGAAGEAKGHGPEGGLACPVGDLVEGCAVQLLAPILPIRLFFVL